ncbi:DUF1007 family protein [Treponema phagedenis]|uniref:DUF1007 family protein n=1 Tax=Treponema phagedenis TaxID=162 RepID=UPI003709C4EB
MVTMEDLNRFFSAILFKATIQIKTGVFNKTETEDVYIMLLLYLKLLLFYFIRQGGNTHGSPKSVSQFSVCKKTASCFIASMLTYPLYPAEKLYFAVYDYSFFCDFRYDTKTGKFYL